MSNCSKRYLNKKGVALITVLLFMTIATIAATGVYKLLASENLSSAARLRQNEAYQASQAGLNVTRAWLSYNGNEAAALVSQFAKDAQHRPISLNERMSLSGLPNMQNFSVLLAGVDTTGTGGIKLKLVSTGKGPAGSRYSQVAILNVEGLYRVEIPSASGDVNYSYAYFGGSMFFDGNHKITSAMINGNWEHNPLDVEEDFIVTGNLGLSGNKVNIGGTACVGGDLVDNGANGFYAKSVYVDGDAAGMLNDITGDAYFNGNVDVSKADFNVGGNFFANKSLRTNPSAHSATFNGNFCMSENGHIVFGEGQGHEFRVQKNVWLPSSGAMSGSMKQENDMDKKFGLNPDSKVFISEMYMDDIHDGFVHLHQEGNFFTDLWGMISGEYNWRYFVSQASHENRSSSVVGVPPFDCADSLPTYCHKKWHPTSEGCDGSKYKIDDLLTTAYSSFEKKANKVACAANIHTFKVDEMNNCFEEAARNGDANLYNGFLVLKFNAVDTRPTGTLTGKFIIIYENDGGNQLVLPPSTGVTMLYLKNGVSGSIMQSSADASSTYNYFIYTKKDIGTILSSPAPWRGSFYAEAASCAKLQHFNDGSLEYDPKILSALISAEAICKAGSRCGSDDSGDTGEEGSSTAVSSKDSRWISLAPTLKISLLSQYANEENVSVENNEMEDGLVVMPRVLYLNVGDMLSNGSDKLYNVIYYGGLESSGTGTASCYFGDKLGEGSYVSETSPFESTGLHTCQYSENGYTSDFWVWVMDASTSAKVSFETLRYDLAEKCKTGTKTKDIKIKLDAERPISGGSLNIIVFNRANGATVTPQASLNGLYTLTEQESSNGGALYKLELAPRITAIEEPLFTVEILGGCATASGYVQFQLLDEVTTDNLGIAPPSNELILLGDGAGPVAHRPIDMDENVTDSIKNIPECTEYASNEVTWIPSIEGCSVPTGVDPDPFYGPWLCPLSAVVGLNISSYYDERLCRPVYGSLATVENQNDTAFVYASLKKTPYTLKIDIQGLMGSANIYESQNSVSLDGKTKEELEEDAAVELLDENDKVLGTCKTGGVLYKDGKNVGPCDIMVYYGQNYYVRAKGKYFDHWSFNCASKSSTFACGTAMGASTKTRLIAVTISEDVTLQANYTKTGYCFNEDFTHLHPYCDYEVTPKAIGGLTQARSNNKESEYYRTDVKNEKDPDEKNRKIKNTEALYGDYGHGDGEYCIDQCVTNWKYRYSELVAAAGKIQEENVGTNYDYYYDYYCSVEGKTIDGSVKEKEDQVWSYFDPGISCNDMVDRAFDDWKLPWTFNPAFSVPKATAKTNCGADGENLTYRCMNGTNPNSTNCKNTPTKKYHPHSLEKPRVYGGYYPQTDKFSPWIKVMGVNLSQQTKLGVRRAPEGKTIIDDEGNSKSVKLSMWNVKPYIDRKEGFISMHGFKTSFIMLRKEKAGYNGTFTKTFTWNGTGESNDGGSVSAIVFRSNADASSFFLLGINPSANNNDATQQHFILCHGTERLIFPESFQLSGTQNTNEARELQTPLTQGHCITEDIYANLPWSAIQDKTLQLKVELDGSNAKITFSYTNDKTVNVGTSENLFNGTNSTIYISKTFNLEDSRLFGYPIDDDKWSERIPKVDEAGNSTHIFKDPIEDMKNHPEDYGYVGFVVHNQNEKIYNLNWRSGGSCGGDYRQAPGIYCGFEKAEVPVKTHVVPIRYVFDYCPDQGECKCTYKYSLNGGTWVDEAEFQVDEARKYPYGALRVKAECYDENTANNTPAYVDSLPCNGFTATNGSDDVCYDNYSIFMTYSNAESMKLFELYSSQITGLDDNYLKKIGTYAGTEGDELRKKYCTDTEDNVVPTATDAIGESHYSASNFCSRQKSDGAVGKAHDVNGNANIEGTNVRVHPKDGVDRNTALDYQKLMMIGHGVNADPYNGVSTGYLQLIDTIDNTNTKRYLNLSNSDLTFRVYQNNIVDDIRVFLEDDAGVLSQEFSIDDIAVGETEASKNMGSLTLTKNESVEYCNIYDDRISEAKYNALSTDDKLKFHKELCQLNLVWVRDLKRIARKDSWQNIYPYRTARKRVDEFKGGTNFDPTRVSKIWFAVHNDRGGGIHISQLKTECHTALDVTGCKISKAGADSVTSTSIGEGQNLMFSAKVPGASYCRLAIHPVNTTNNTYEYIRGWPTDWFACNREFRTDSLALECDNPSGDCSGKFMIIAKNASDELDSCATGATSGMQVNVNQTKFTCYGYNTNYEIPRGQSTPTTREVPYRSELTNHVYDAGNIEYEGVGNISMGIDFNDGGNLRTNPTPIKLIGPDGQLLQEIAAGNVPGENDAARFPRCSQRKEGTTWIKTNKDGSFNSYQGGVRNNCAFFQFNPTSTGSGDYKLVFGNGQTEACKINITVPNRKISQNCVIGFDDATGTHITGSNVSVNKSQKNIVVSADGEYLDDLTGTITVGSKSYSCSYEPNSEGDTHGIVSCESFDAPSESGNHTLKLEIGGRTSTCQMKVMDKPTPSDCKISSDGRFTAKVSNPNEIEYKYRLIRCADPLGNGCTIEGSSMAEHLPLEVGIPTEGQNGTYIFQVSTTGNFEEDVASCKAEYNSSEDVKVECEIIPAVAGVGKTVNFVAKNAENLSSNKTMTVMRNGNALGSIEVKVREGSTYSVDADVIGEHTFTLVNSEGQDVCKTPAKLNVVPVSADCDFVVAEVGKGSEVTFRMSNISNLDADITLTLSGGSNTQPLNLSKGASYYEYKTSAPASVGTYDYTLTTSDGTPVCSSPATLKVLPVTATCNYITADESVVEKIMAKVPNIYNPSGPLEKAKVDFIVSDIQNLKGSVETTIKCDKKDMKLEGVKLTLSEYNATSRTYNFYEIPEINGKVTCSLMYGKDAVCSKTLSIAQPLEPKNCEIGNDNGWTAGNAVIENSNKTKNTHFYFYYSTGSITSFTVTNPWNGGPYDVQGDPHSSYEPECSGHERPGFKCVTVYPKVECKTCHSYGWTYPCEPCEGFKTGEPYKYKMCTTSDDFYGGSVESCCTKDLRIIN